MDIPSQVISISVEEIIGGGLLFFVGLRYMNHAMKFVENFGMNLYEVKIKKNGNGNGSRRTDDIQRLRKTIKENTENWDCKSVDTTQLLETLITETKKSNKLHAIQLSYMQVDDRAALDREVIQALSG